MKMAIEQSAIVSEIESMFTDLCSYEKQVHDINEQIRRLTNRKNALLSDMRSDFIKLLCLVAVDTRMYNGKQNKIPLVRLHRTIHGSCLKDAKDIVEQFVDPQDIPF